MNRLFYILLLFCATIFAQNEALFKHANSLYNEGKYSEAIEKYDAILKSKKHSSELYFNLANSYYKLNNIPNSIFYYEKALQLNPDDEEIKNNLVYAQNMTIDAIDVIPEVGFSKLIKNLTNRFSFDAWAKTSIVFVFCFVILFLVYYFATYTLLKRLTFIGSIVTLLLIVICLAFAFKKFSLDKRDNPAIVFAQESQVKSDPNLKSEEVFRLHEGTKVQVLETYNSWKKIQLSDGKTGWVLAEDIKLLNNF